MRLQSSFAASICVYPAATLALFLTGCSLSPTAVPGAQPGMAFRGAVHGGQQPVAGAHVHLFAANTTGYGQASLPLLSTTLNPSLLSDSLGPFVATGADGSFSLTADYACAPNSQVYLYAFGGNPGFGGNNPSASFLASIGNCPSSGSFPSTSFISVNEVSTIAAAYSLNYFALDPLHISSPNTTTSLTAIANSFARTNALASLSSGFALAATPAGNGIVPQAEINTLADILSACVNSTGAVTGPASPSACYTLFANATSDGTPTGILPSDTATAALNIAHHPWANIPALCALQTATAPFLPQLPCSVSHYPNDFSLGISFTSGGGLSNPHGIGVDPSGNVWFTNPASNSITELDPSGTPLSPSTGFTGGGLDLPWAVTFDANSNADAWIANLGGGVTELSPLGVPASGSPYIPGQYALAIFTAANAKLWMALTDSGIAAVDTSGTPLAGSPFPSNGLGSASSITVNSSGQVFVSYLAPGGISIYTGAGAPITNITGSNINYPVSITSFGPNVTFVNEFANSITQITPSSPGVTPETFAVADFFGGGLSTPGAIAADPNGGALVVGNRGSNCVSTFFANGSVRAPDPGLCPLVPSTFNGITGVSIDHGGGTWANYNGSGITLGLNLVPPASPAP